jgi:hypothetical protein
VDRHGRVGVAYLAGKARGAGSSLPVSVRLRTYNEKDGSLAEDAEREIGSFEYVWPGDYMRLVATTEGFRVAHVGAGDGPANPTEVYFR